MHGPLMLTWSVDHIGLSPDLEIVYDASEAGRSKFTRGAWTASSGTLAFA